MSLYFENLRGNEVAHTSPLGVFDMSGECIATAADLPAPSYTNLSLPLSRVADISDVVTSGVLNRNTAAHEIVALAVSSDVPP